LIIDVLCAREEKKIYHEFPPLFEVTGKEYSLLFLIVVVVDFFIYV
jgi:hypothetical protein